MIAFDTIVADLCASSWPTVVGVERSFRQSQQARSFSDLADFSLSQGLRTDFGQAEIDTNWYMDMLNQSSNENEKFIHTNNSLRSFPNS